MKTLHVQLSITLDETAARTLAELLAPAMKQAIGQMTSESKPARDVQIRASRNAGFGGEKPPDHGLLIDSRGAARLLKVSPRTLWKMQNNGEMPPPIRIGRAVRWSLDALQKWIEEGCTGRRHD